MPYEGMPLDGSKANVIRESATRLSLNSQGLPDGFYRADLLPSDRDVKAYNRSRLGDRATRDTDYELDGFEDALDAAFVRLSYDEGFPSQPDGRPFWEPLECEPPGAYTAFKAYLEQGNTGTRGLHELARDPDICLLAGPSTDTGSPSVPAVQAAQATKCLAEWFNIYYWRWRSRSYDLFHLDHIKRQRDMMSLSLENRHYLDSSRLYDKVMLYMGFIPDGESVPEEALDENGEVRFWKQASPKVMLDALKVAAQMQRLSLGLPAAAPATQTRVLDPNGPSKGKGVSDSGRGNDEPDEVLDISDDERARRVTAILNRARARRDRQT